MNVSALNSQSVARSLLSVPTLSTLVLSLLLLAGLTGCQKPAALEPAPDPLAYETPVGDGDLKTALRYVIVFRKDDTFQLHVRIKVTNGTDKVLDIPGGKDFTMLNGEGKEVPYFIAPLSTEDTAIEPGATSEASLNFRPSMEDFQGPLYLSFPGGKKMVKDRGAVGNDRLPNTISGKKAFRAVDWTDSLSVMLLGNDV